MQVFFVNESRTAKKRLFTHYPLLFYADCGKIIQIAAQNSTGNAAAPFPQMSERRETMQIHQSAEDYLEAILILKNQKGAVRSIDIAVHMNYSKPSISRAVSLLRENGYIVVDKDGYITLTDAGMEIASRIYERHELIRKWLIKIGVPEEVAAQDACKMEHDLSVVTFERMKAYIQKTLEG